MKILLVSATLKEIEGVLQTLENLKCLKEGFFRGFAGINLIDVRLTGVGAAATAENMICCLQFSRYDLVLNAGICGSFTRDLGLGTVVNIVSETWADLGAEDHDDFLDLFDLGILESGAYPFSGKELVNNGNIYSRYISKLPRVKAVTVNKAHGNIDSIDQCVKKYKPDVESMEGAAVFNICISQGQNFLCLRSISNFVEPRCRKNWDTETAIRNLSAEINRIISVIRK